MSKDKKADLGQQDWPKDWPPELRQAFHTIQRGVPRGLPVIWAQSSDLFKAMNVPKVGPGEDGGRLADGQLLRGEGGRVVHAQGGIVADRR